MTRVPSVLIVDDDREIRRLVSRFLVENGFVGTDAGYAAGASNNGWVSGPGISRSNQLSSCSSSSIHQWAKNEVSAHSVNTTS